MGQLRRPTPEPVSEPAFDPTSWAGAIIVMTIFGAVLWIIQVINASENQGLDRFGLKPRRVDGLWGILTAPFLHDTYGHLVANTFPVILIGWALLLSGVRTWLFVTVVVVVLGDLATWLVAPSGKPIVGASGLVFGWMGYLLARAYFSRKLKWIITAVSLLTIFGALLGNLIPAADTRTSWPSHLCCFAAGVLVGWFLHPRGGRNSSRPRRARPVVS
jgi:membrane associated rhomboid family serine protease